MQKPSWERLKGFLWLLITQQTTGEGRSESAAERKVETTVYTVALIFRL